MPAARSSSPFSNLNFDLQLPERWSYECEDWAIIADPLVGALGHPDARRWWDMNTVIQRPEVTDGLATPDDLR